jgi:predicted nucleic acid-binding protein
MRAVLDTNILISALISSAGNPAIIYTLGKTVNLLS